jgi:hypothetical protein
VCSGQIYVQGQATPLKPNCQPALSFNVSVGLARLPTMRVLDAPPASCGPWRRLQSEGSKRAEMSYSGSAKAPSDRVKPQGAWRSKRDVSLERQFGKARSPTRGLRTPSKPLEVARGNSATLPILVRLQAASSSNFSTLHVFQIRYRELSPLRDTPRPPDHPTTLPCWKRRNQVCLVHVSYVRRHIGTWCAPRLPERADWVQWDSNPIPKERGLKSVEKLRPGGKKTSAMIARCRLHV